MAKRASRSNHDHWLVGRSTTVLKEEFVTSFKTNNNFVMSDWFPFNGKLKLPTKEEVLKLTLFLRVWQKQSLREAWLPVLHCCWCRIEVLGDGRV